MYIGPIKVHVIYSTIFSNGFFRLNGEEGCTISWNGLTSLARGNVVDPVMWKSQ